MARSPRSFLARLLPWAALAVMTVFFFVQVRARERAEADARTARALPAQSAATPPSADGEETSVAADPDELAMLRSAVATRASELKRANTELDALRAERDALHAQLERAAASRAAQAERAAALLRERDEWRKAAQEKLAVLQEGLRKTEALLAARRDVAAEWVQAVAGKDEGARTQALAAAKSADATQKERLRSLWAAEKDASRLRAFADIVATWKPGEVASDLAGRLVAAAPAGADPDEILQRLSPHVSRVEGMAAVLASPSVRVLRAALPWLDPGAVEWSAEDRARLAGVLAPRLDSSDAAILQAVASGLGRVGTPAQTDALTRLLGHADAGVRLTAAWALMRILGAERARSTAGKAVADLLAVEDAAVRTRAVQLARDLLGEDGPASADLDAEASRLRALLTTASAGG